MRLDQVQLLPCPLDGADVAKLPAEQTRAIVAQNELIARIQHDTARAGRQYETRDEWSETRSVAMFKMRRDDLLEIVGRPLEYSWRKRDIAERELRFMGYDIREMVDVSRS